MWASAYRCPTRRSTSRSPSTAPRSGRIHTSGSRRLRALLRPGGRLVFLRNSTLVVLCQQLGGAVEQLQRPQRGLNRIEWPDTGEVEFQLPPGELIDLLHGTGFELERLLELYAPDDAETHAYYDFVTADWARQWPAEELWVARKL